MNILKEAEAGADRTRIIGVNRRHYPTFIWAEGVDHEAGNVDGWSQNPPGITTVLVLGDIGDYAAYTGIGSDEWVARHGDKISFEEACVHFPGGQLQREKYRER